MSTTTTETSAGFWAGFVGIAGAVATVAALVLLRTWVLTVLWGWYVVPAFGVQPLRMAHAFGLALFTTYLLSRHDKGDEGMAHTIKRVVLSATGALVAGWIGTWFI